MEFADRKEDRNGLRCSGALSTSDKEKRIEMALSRTLRKLTVILALLAAIGLLACIPWLLHIPRHRTQPGKSTSIADLPDATEIQNITVTHYGFRNESVPRVAEIPEFAVPEEHFANILKWLRPSRSYRFQDVDRPPAEHHFADLKITTHGKVTVVKVFWLGGKGSPVLFSLDGLSFFEGPTERLKDGGLMLQQALAEAYRAFRTGP